MDTDHTASFRPDKTILFIRDPVAVYASLSEKPYANSSIPSFYTTENIPLNDLHPDTVSAKRAMRGDSLCSGMVGINS